MTEDHTGNQREELPLSDAAKAKAGLKNDRSVSAPHHHHHHHHQRRR